MRIYKLANGYFPWLPCTKSCLGRLSFLTNCCAYVENPFPFLGTLVLPVENLKVPLFGYNCYRWPFCYCPLGLLWCHISTERADLGI